MNRVRAFPCPDIYPKSIALGDAITNGFTGHGFKSPGYQFVKFILHQRNIRKVVSLKVEVIKCL